MKLRQLDIKGFKSIDADVGQSIPLGDITVLLGANGSGKSNLLSFFAMLQCLLIKQGLAEFVGKYGVNRLLFYGAKKTSAISFTAFFDDERDSRYQVELKRGLPDGLFVGYERIDASYGYRYLPNDAAGNFYLFEDQEGNRSLPRDGEGYCYLSKDEEGNYCLPKDEERNSGLVQDVLSRQCRQLSCHV